MRLRILVALLTFSACNRASVPAGQSTRFRLYERGAFQALYAPNGNLARVLNDKDGDHRADTIVLFHPNGKPSAGEIDTDRDGVIDRWEYFSVEGIIKTIAVSRRKEPRPNFWEHYSSKGILLRREWDDDNDGSPDRAEELTERGWLPL